MEKNETLLKNFSILSKEQRLHKVGTPIVALTGGIAMGKSTVVAYLQKLNYQVIMADQLVKMVYEQNSVQEWVQKNRAQVIINNKIDFVKLRSETFTDSNFKTQLENLIYAQMPEVFRSVQAKLPKHSFFFYEVPLLVEKKLYPHVDLMVLLHSDSEIQKNRLNERDSKSVAVHENILKSQLSFEDKKPYAHFTIFNNGTTQDLIKEVDQLLIEIHLLLGH